MIRNHKSVLIAIVIGLSFVYGCSENMRAPASGDSVQYKTSEAPRSGERATGAAADKSVDGKQESQLPLPDIVPDTGRQIIYTANMSIVVQNFDTLPDEINRIVGQCGGYISETNVGRLQGTRRSGRWTIRIPVLKYRDFLQSASGIGVPESLTENAQDVSEEFVDLDARITSSKKLEEQVIRLLEKQTDKIENLIAIERELARIRLEVERMEGRLRYLSNQVAMSTVHLSATEQTTFIPAEQPSLDKRVQTEWTEAIGRAKRFVEGTLLALVANSFVIGAWLVGALILWVVIRRWRKKSRRTPSPVA